MVVVLLAAGNSTRMGTTNKLLISYNGMPMVAHCAMQALQYLKGKTEESSLIVVTGYRKQDTENALSCCKDFIAQTNISMTIVHNSNYLNGQFSSTKIGVDKVPDCTNFFISLADMPFITPDHYKAVEKHLSNYDAVRPFCNNKPGHPVLCTAKLKNVILQSPDSVKMYQILDNFNVCNPDFTNESFTCDLDTPDDVALLQV